MSEQVVNGSKAIDFTYNTAFEEGLHLSETVKKAEKTFLIFLRYLGCTSCQVDILDYSEQYARLTEKNAQILVVLQSKASLLRDQTSEQKPPFQLISDPDMSLYSLYELPAASSKETMIDKNDPQALARLQYKRQKAGEHGFTHGEYEGNELQLPAVFLLDSDMNVLYAHRAKNLTDMPDVDEMVAML